MFTASALKQAGRTLFEARRSTTMESSPSAILAKDAKAFNSLKSYDIFLSHSVKDGEIIYGLKGELEKQKLTVYVDWIEDPQLSRENVNKGTARTLKERMKVCRGLLYATSQNTQDSRWMPWELGYFDGIKNKVAICPISESGTTFTKSEYLQLYPKAEPHPDPKENYIWIWEDGKILGDIRTWLNTN